MSFWESNSAIISRQYPGLLEEITVEPDLAREDIQVETTAPELPALKIRGIYVHSPRDPLRESIRLAESLNAAETDNTHSSPVIILGFGLGYAAEAAGKLFPERPLIIVEKYRSLLKLALELRDMRTLLERRDTVFVPGGSGEGVTSALSLFEKTAGIQLDEQSPPAIIRNRALTGIDEEWYAAIESRIRAWTTRGDVNAATLKKFGKRWIRNLSRNMSCIRDLPGISRLAGLAASTQVSPDAEALPVFLAAAGPGLDQAGPLLPEISRRCITVAVDTSLRFFLKHKIAPDFALVVDPQFWNNRHLDRCVPQETRLIAESAVYPPALRLPFKEIYLCGSLFPLGSFIEKRVDPKGELGAGGSVATTAWDFARVLGGGEIWTAGLDLAFPSLKTHFRGAAFEEKAITQSSRRIPAETWQVRALRDGLPFHASAAGNTGQVLTDRRLSLYASWFENRFRQYPDVHTYSLSSGGLAINGLENTGENSLLNLRERRNEINRRLADVSSRIETEFFATEETRKRAERYENAVAILRQGLTNIKAAAEEGAEIAEHALNRHTNQSEREKILKNLDETTRAIVNSEVKEVAGFLFPPATDADTKNAPNDPFRAYLESSRSLYRSLAETTEFNLRYLPPPAK